MVRLSHGTIRLLLINKGLTTECVIHLLVYSLLSQCRNCRGRFFKLKRMARSYHARMGSLWWHRTITDELENKSEVMSILCLSVYSPA